MNEILDKLGAAAKRAAGAVGTEVSIAAEEQKVRDAYRALGKLYYQDSRAGREPSGIAYADQCRRIDAALKRIEELKESKKVAPEPYADEEDFENVQ